MNIQTEQHIIRLIENDEWMMDVLQLAKSLELPDWWICAGLFVLKFGILYITTK